MILRLVDSSEKNVTQICDWVPQHINSSLDQSKQRLFSEHLQKCKACQQEEKLFKEFKVGQHTLSNSSMRAINEGFAKLLIKIDRAEVKTSTRHKPEKTRHQTWIRFGMATAVFILFSVTPPMSAYEDYVTLHAKSATEFSTLRSHRDSPLKETDIKIQLVIKPDLNFRHLQAIIENLDNKLKPMIIEGSSKKGIYIISFYLLSHLELSKILKSLRENPQILVAELYRS